MIIWSGWGILAASAAALGCGTASVRGVALLDVTGLHCWPGLAFGLGLLATVNWRVGRRLNGGPSQRLTDQATRQTVMLRWRHSLLIPIQWRSAPLAIAGVLSLLAAMAAPPGPGVLCDGTVQP